MRACRLRKKERAIERWAVIDVETTGASPGVGCLTEIAVITYDGTVEQERFTTLLKPEMPIPRRIEWYTGISNAMVADAPRFCEVARKLVEMTSDRVLVGHNIAFDYGHLKAAYADLGYRYRRQCMCTLRLARKLLPARPSYRLAALNDELQLGGEVFHRALADAETTAGLFFALQGLGNMPLPDAGTLAPHLPQEALADVPAQPGIYQMYNLQGAVIYVGKSKDLRHRLKQHVLFTRNNAGDQRTFFAEVSSFTYVPTGSELIAELEELHLIKTCRPAFNRVGKRTEFRYALVACNVRRELVVKSLRRDGRLPAGTLLARYGSKRSAEQARDRLMEQYGVHAKLPDAVLSLLWQRIAADFTYPFSDGQVRLPGRQSDEFGFVVIRQGVYQGYYFASQALPWGEQPLVQRPEYEDLKRLLCRRLRGIARRDRLVLKERPSQESYGDLG